MILGEALLHQNHRIAFGIPETRHPKLLGSVAMHHMGPVDELTPTSRNGGDGSVNVVDPVVEDRSGPEGLVFRSPEIQPHPSTVEEGHGLAWHLKQEFETEHVPIPGDRSVHVADADVNLANRCRVIRQRPHLL